MFRFLRRVVVVIVFLSISLVLPLRWVNPATTSFILQDEKVESIWIYKQWEPLTRIADDMQVAVIASEDQRFPDHYGIDVIELKKALSQSGGPRRGASTITQQLAKNLYLWPSQNILRKAIEAYLAVVIDILLPKPRILELYLNVIEYGEGIYGISQASQQFFEKKPKQLSRIDASLLAAVLPNPKKSNAAAPSPYLYNRALDIRFAMRNLGGTNYLRAIK